MPDLSRRGFIVAGSGLLLASLWGVGGLAGTGRDASLIRPPGSLDEDRFLARCIRCGQCMRICPANIIHPALLEAGVQGLWTPAINYRLSRSGCQPNCIACGQVCPTAAIRPFSLDEKQGAGDFAAQGPIRMGTAFVDRGRCLPWAMDRPCLVCHELCPVSPKAIFTRTAFETIRDGEALPAKVQGPAVELGCGHPHRSEPGQRRLLSARVRTARGGAPAHHRPGRSRSDPGAPPGRRRPGGSRSPGGYRGALVAAFRGRRQVYRLRHVRA